MLSSLLLSSQQHIRQRSSVVARRHITSAQKRALKRKQANKTSTSDGATSNQVSSSNNHVGTAKNIPKAPHMQSQMFESTAAGKKNGVLDTIKDNPLIFAIFVFPTVMMGVALIVRPDFRAQILGSGGNGDKDKAKMRSNASINVPDDASAPVYEETNGGDVAAGDDKENVAKDTEEEGSSLKSSSTKSDNLQQSENELGGENESKGGGEVKDLIYALGIRPHPSL